MWPIVPTMYGKVQSKAQNFGYVMCVLLDWEEQNHCKSLATTCLPHVIGEKS